MALGALSRKLEPLMTLARLVPIGVAACLFSARATAQISVPATHEPTAFDFMNLLAQHGLHDLANERWNAYGQATYITTFKPSFHAPYTNANGSVNSLVPDYER